MTLFQLHISFLFLFFIYKQKQFCLAFKVRSSSFQYINPKIVSDHSIHILNPLLFHFFFLLCRSHMPSVNILYIHTLILKMLWKTWYVKLIQSLWRITPSSRGTQWTAARPAPPSSSATWSTPPSPSRRTSAFRR